MKATKTKAKPSANKTKRSRNGTGHVRLRADGRWEGQYYFEGERKSCYGQTEEECQGKLNVVLGKIYRGTYVDGSMMPFYTYMHFWHEKYILVRPATHTNYETYIEKHIILSLAASLLKNCAWKILLIFSVKRSFPEGWARSRAALRQRRCAI